jgi:hypothetical protein
MAIQISPRQVSIGVRALERRLFFPLIYFLRYRASKWAYRMAAGRPVDLCSRKKFLAKNMQLQERLWQLFTPFHHLCSRECSCCISKEIPYGLVDSALYGISPDQLPINSPFRIPEMARVLWGDSIMLLIRHCQRFFLGKPASHIEAEPHEQPDHVCPALSETGCTLPLGMRPVFCVQWICGRFLREMTSREYQRCLMESIRYLAFLTVSLQLVVAEWRQKQRDTRLTNKQVPGRRFSLWRREKISGLI